MHLMDGERKRKRNELGITNWKYYYGFDFGRFLISDSYIKGSYIKSVLDTIRTIEFFYAGYNFILILIRTIEE